MNDAREQLEVAKAECARLELRELELEAEVRELRAGRSRRPIPPGTAGAIDRFTARVKAEAVAAERERCAALVEHDVVHGDFTPTSEADVAYYDAMVKFAAAIRAGGDDDG